MSIKAPGLKRSWTDSGVFPDGLPSNQAQTEAVSRPPRIRRCPTASALSAGATGSATDAETPAGQRHHECTFPRRTDLYGMPPPRLLEESPSSIRQQDFGPRDG